MRASAPESRAFRKKLTGGAIEPLAGSPQVPQSLDRSAAVPRGHFSIDGRDPLFPQQRLGAQLGDLSLAEEVGLAGEKHDAGSVEQAAVELDLRVAVGALRRNRFPIDEGEHPRHIGVARYRHPGIPPYQVEHAIRRKRARRGLQRSVHGLEFAAQDFGPVLAPEYSADQPVERKVVEGAERVRDDQRRNEPGESARILLSVLVDIEDDVGGPQRAQLVEVDVLGAADLGDPANDLAGMNAEAGSAHELCRKPEIADELADARHEAHDARIATGRRVPRARGIDEFPLRSPHRGRPRAFRGALANNRSNSQRGRRRSTNETSAICQGMTAKRRFAAMARANRRAASSASMMKGMR